jgi:hypothetical protein
MMANTATIFESYLKEWGENDWQAKILLGKNVDAYF